MNNKTAQKTIYQKYGGFKFFHSCIYELYNEMFIHPEISLHFLGVDIHKLSLHQTQFLVRQIGGPRLYQGKPVGWVHRKRGISEYQFREIASAFEKIFLKNGVSSQDTAIIMTFINGKKPKIVTVRFAWIDLVCWPFYQIHAFMSQLVTRLLDSKKSTD